MLESCTMDDIIIMWFSLDKGKRRRNSESETNPHFLPLALLNVCKKVFDALLFLFINTPFQKATFSHVPFKAPFPEKLKRG